MYEDTDLHTHSTASDGGLPPAALVARAFECGVRTLALTDHDTVAGVAEAADAARRLGLRLIAGVELSLLWEKTPLHVVGLNVDTRSAALQEATARLDQIRIERAQRIGERLAKLGMPGAYEGACAEGGTARPGRAHFARHLLRTGRVTSLQAAFDRLLRHGRPAYVATDWPELEEGIEGIHQAGGVAVLAHPLDYDLTASKLRRLAATFKAAGGEAIEVINGRIGNDRIHTGVVLAQRHALLGSAGSDFHSPDTPHSDLGRLPAFPAGLDHVIEALPARPEPRP